MKILITGGAGFIGSHLCDRCIKAGHDVICLDNFFSGDLINIRHLLTNKRFKLINGDVRNADLVDKTTMSVDSIIHLAAQIHVDRSIIEPKLTYDINVGGTLNVLESARANDVDRVLFASSSEVYGTAEFSSMNEQHPLNAPHPYGASKTAGDRMCFAYNRTYDMDVTIVRSFNVYGIRQKDSGYGGALSLFSNRVMRGLPPIIYGSGNQTRDYLYIDDLVSGYEMLLNKTTQTRDPINFGTGVNIRIIDLANKIIRMFGKRDIVPIHIEPRPGEVDNLIADISVAKGLGWKPTYTIDEGLEYFINWYKTH